MKAMFKKKLVKGLLLLAINFVLVFTCFSVKALAATRYEVTKSGGAWVRVSYKESATGVVKKPQGSILWVESSKINSSGNLWYRLTDGNWIFSGNVKKHTCTGTWISGYNSTCTATGTHNYRCNKCGNVWSNTYAALGHNYDGHVCTRCGVWDTGSLKSRSSVNNVKYYVTANGTKVHSGPYGKAATVATLNRGNEIFVVERVVNASNNVWYRYSGGYIFSDYVIAHNSCSWNGGTVTVKSTCTTTGQKVQHCTICGRSRTITLARAAHKYDGHVCTSCGTWDTSSLKSRKSVSNVKYYVKTSGASVHSGPYGKTRTIATLNRGTDIYVTEKIVNASGNVWYRYSGGYIFSDYVVEHNSCSWNSGTVTKKATCTATGTKVHSCTICGRTKTVTLAKVSHKYEGNVCACGAWKTSSLKSAKSVNNVKYYVKTSGAKVHSGPYGKTATVKTLSKGIDIVVTQRVVNASGNVWYKCSGGYVFSDYVVEHNSCSWNKGTVTKKATCTATGSKVHHCTICGKAKTVTLAKVSHKYKSNVCTACGNWNKSSLKSQKTVNNVKYYVVKAAKVHSGPYAGCKTVKTLPKGTEITVTQKIVNGERNVWYKYSGGYIYGGYVKEHDSCHWNKGTVTKKSTCAATGAKVHTCTVCGKTKTVTLAKVSHKYKSNVCTACGTWNTASLRSKTSLNNVKYYVIKSDAKVHSGPYAGCKTVKKLPKGTPIVVTQKLVNASRNTWYKCQYGYIYGEYVQHTDLYTAKTTLNAASKTLYVQQGATLKATVKGPSSKVTWKSSNTSVATVDSKGNVMAKKSGSCTIYATANGKTAACKITVKQLAAPQSVVFTTLTNGRNFKVSHKAVSGADGYEIVYVGNLQRKTKTYTGTSATITVPKSNDCSFECSIRAYKLINGKKYYGKSTKVVSVHVHNAKEDIASRKITKFAAVDYNYHNTTVTNTYSCASCKKSITYTKVNKVKHTFTCGVCQTCGKKQAANFVVGKMYPTLEDSKGPSYSSAEKNKKNQNPIYMATKYSDSFFLGSSSTFSTDLCKLSAIGAAASYNKAFGKSFLTECGFTAIKAANSSAKASTAVAGDNDHARYIIGYKKIAGTDKVVVGVLINGYTTGKYEWISNFNVGKSGLHEGFSKAANEITAQINAYIKANNINTSKVKIWLTGHSRGGAVTGMTAVKLNQQYGAANVFAYGFATPNGVPNDMADDVYSKNVFNIVNSGDFVPYVVPTSWGFTKYGTTRTLSLNSSAKGFYKVMTKDNYDGMTDSERKSLVKAFNDYSPNRKAYYTAKGSASPSYLGRALGLFLSEAGACDECLDLIGRCVTSNGDSVGVFAQMIYNGKLTTNIHEAHGMETYVAMIFAAYN